MLVNKKITLQDCQALVAKKHLGGTKLVMGHRVTYFDEAAEMYVQARVKEALDEYKELMKDN